jgi:hypothetical protein
MSETAQSKLDKANKLVESIKNAEAQISKFRKMKQEVEGIASEYLRFQPVNDPDLARNLLVLGLRERIVIERMKALDHYVLTQRNELDKLMGIS